MSQAKNWQRKVNLTGLSFCFDIFLMKIMSPFYLVKNNKVFVAGRSLLVYVGPEVGAGHWGSYLASVVVSSGGTLLMFLIINGESCLRLLVVIDDVIFN